MTDTSNARRLPAAFDPYDADTERMLADRGVVVDHTTLYRWILVYAPELDKRIRPHLRQRVARMWPVS